MSWRPGPFTPSASHNPPLKGNSQSCAAEELKTKAFSYASASQAACTAAPRSKRSPRLAKQSSNMPAMPSAS